MVFTVSLEAVLWVALLAVAFTLRLASLDRLPLSESESARAFGAWLVSKGSVPGSWPGDLSAALTSHLFRVFGSGETVARIIPAVGGSALVASFWFASRYLGRGVALLAAVLIALSPLAVYTSRSALGFALGGLLSMIMVLSLLAYLRQQRPLPAVVLSAALGLALASDPIATSTAAALIVFLVVEGAWRTGGAVSEAVTTFRSTPDHWRPAALALGVTLLLGVAQFGTDVDRLSLAGLRQWTDMFALPRDSLPWHYPLTLLLWYEWPLLLAGAAGYLVVVRRWMLRSETPSLAQRLLVMWATAAVVVVAFATRRESGQVLLLLLPLSLLAATLIEEALSKMDWDPLRRWWPAVALALAVTAYGLLQLTRWAREGGQISDGEKAYMVLALIGAATIIAAGFYYLGRNGLALALPLAAALTVPFLVHSSLSLAFRDGAEFATDTRSAPGVEPLRTAVAQAAERTGLPVAVDPRLRDALGWHLRDAPFVFGDPVPGAAVVTAAGRGPPPGMEPLGKAWQVAGTWVPDDLDLLQTWRWFVYRQPYGDSSTMEAQVLVPTQ